LNKSREFNGYVFTDLKNFLIPGKIEKSNKRKMIYDDELNDKELLGNHDNYSNVVYVDKNGNRCDRQSVNYLVKSRERYVKSSSRSNTGKEFVVSSSFEGQKE
jgi:hypothetical protein